jgi:hypothetical protein
MNKLKLFGLVVAVIAGALLLRQCNREKVPSYAPILAADDQAKVLIDHNKITVVKRNPNGTTDVSTKFVPDRGEVIFKKDGSVEIHVKQFGWIAEPGMGYILSAEGSALALDCQVMYWRRMGLNAGVGMRLGVKAITANELMRDGLRPYLAISYRLPWNIVSNTSTMVGYAPLNKLVVVGLRVKF